MGEGGGQAAAMPAASSAAAGEQTAAPAGGADERAAGGAGASGGAGAGGGDGHVRLGELMKSDPAAFVRHLSGRCDLLDARAPENSRLLRLFAADGPMYGVASADDLRRIEQWIGSVAQKGACAA